MERTSYRKDEMCSQRQNLMRNHSDSRWKVPRLNKRVNCLVAFTVVSIVIGAAALTISVLLLLQALDLSEREQADVDVLQMRINHLEHLLGVNIIKEAQPPAGVPGVPGPLPKDTDILTNSDSDPNLPLPPHNAYDPSQSGERVGESRGGTVGVVGVRLDGGAVGHENGNNVDVDVGMDSGKRGFMEIGVGLGRGWETNLGIGGVNSDVSMDPDLPGPHYHEDDEGGPDDTDVEGSGDCIRNPPRPVCPVDRRICEIKEPCPKYVCC